MATPARRSCPRRRYEILKERIAPEPVRHSDATLRGGDKVLEKSKVLRKKVLRKKVLRNHRAAAVRRTSAFISIPQRRVVRDRDVRCPANRLPEEPIVAAQRIF